MKRHRFDPIEVLRSHQTALQERVERAADPGQKQLLEKRLHNLDGVIQFLTATRSAIDGIDAQAKHEGIATARRAPTTSSAHGREPDQQQWRLTMGTDCGNV